MTSQYVTEPPTSGLVELVTSKGPISIELFSRETPQACRNFLTLALEGFYDNLVFHRLIPNFIIQSGDPSGTGAGGESIFGEPFPIEPHSRLNFNRRGLLAMAAGEDKTNESQFFLTLDATPELQGKHTLMGRVVGNTIYNMIELTAGVEMQKGSDRPRYPPKLLEVRILENPFDDLKPRMTREQRRREERRSREEAERKREEQEKSKRGKAKKNTGLLSFGAEQDDGETGIEVLKGPKSSHDLLKDDKKLSKQPIQAARKSNKTSQVQDKTPAPDAESSAKSDSVVPSSPSATPSAPTSSTNIATTAHAANEKHPSDRLRKKSSKLDTRPSSGRDFLSAERAKYLSSSKPSSSSKDSYSALLSFQSRLRASSRPSTHTASKTLAEDHEDEAKEYGASDDDSDWRNHRLDAGGAPLVVGRSDKLDDYEVLDPRQHNETTETKKHGKRGRDWVDDERRYTHDRSRGSARHHDATDGTSRYHHDDRSRNAGRDHDRRR